MKRILTILIIVTSVLFSGALFAKGQVIWHPWQGGEAVSYQYEKWEHPCWHHGCYKHHAGCARWGGNWMMD